MGILYLYVSGCVMGAVQSRFFRLGFMREGEGGEGEPLCLPTRCTITYKGITRGLDVKLSLVARQQLKTTDRQAIVQVGRQLAGRQVASSYKMLPGS